MRRTVSSLVMALLMVGGFVQPLGAAVRSVEAAAPPSVAAPTGGTISGQVTDDQGAPLPGTQVQILGTFGQTVQTGTDGAYSVAGLADGSYRVSVDTGHPTPPSYTPFVAYPELINVSSSVGQSGVDFELPRAAIITGTIRNEGGIPIPNAQIGGLDSFQYVVSGPDGRYLTAVAAGPYAISAGAPGYIGWNGTGFGFVTGANATPIDTVAGQVTTVDFILHPGGSISGRVLDASGVPVVGGLVSAYRNDPLTGPSDWASANTDASGFYVLHGLKPGDYIVSTASSLTIAGPLVYFPGTTDPNAALPVVVVDAVTTPSIDFALPPPVVLGPPITVTSISPQLFRRGTTTTATLTGSGFVPGATVTIEPYGSPPHAQISFLQVVDSTHVSISVTVPLDATLGADGGLYVTQQGQFADCQCEPFVADATSTFGTISGRVTRSSDGTAVGSVRVTADGLGGSTGFVSSMMTPADGSYALGPLPTGDYVVRFSPIQSQPALASEFYLDAKSDLTSTPVTVVADADTPNVDAALETRVGPAIASVTPAVLTPGTTTDVTVTGTDLGIDDVFNVNSSTYTQPAPRVVAKQVVSSTEVRLSIEADPLTPSGLAIINVFPQGGGASSVCNCMSIAASTDATGTVSGVVADPLGSGLTSIRVTAVLDGQTQPTSAGWTTGDGSYALRLPPGTYALHFEDSAGAFADATAAVVNVGEFNAGVNATIPTPASIGAIAGIVSDSSSQMLSGALVEVTNVTTGETNATLTAQVGSYRFSTLPVGDYSIGFSAPGYQSRWYNDATAATAATPVTVVGGGQVSAIDAALPPSRRPLVVSSLAPSRVVVGESITATINGSGYSFGDVTNLAFSAGDGVTITLIDASPDSAATVSVAVDPTAVPGPRDVVATRDDLQRVSCLGCLRVFSTLSSISGTVASAGGTLPPLVTVTATSVSTGEGFNVQAAAGGAYEVDRLPPDNYRMSFVAQGFVTQWYNNAATAATANLVTVGSLPVVGIDATLQPTRKFLYANSIVPGVVEQGSTTNVTISGSGFLDGGVTNLAFDGGVGVTIQVVSVQSDTSVSAIIIAAPDAAVGAHPLTVTRDDTSTWTCSFCLQVSLARGRISGVVTGAGGAAVAYGFVTVFAVGSTLPPSGAQLQPDGSYTLDNLLPGDYQVQFSGYGTNFAFTYNTEWWNDAPTQAAATVVTVVGGQTVAGIDAQLSVASSPLTLAPGFAPYEAYQGSARDLVMNGGGFLVGVTGLTFSAGPGITIAVGSIGTDTTALVTITTDATAALGPRDLVVTRDDGQTATCTLCLTVIPTPPGAIYATVLDADSGQLGFGSATITPVGASAPIWSQSVIGSIYVDGLAPGDYDVSVTAYGYVPFAARVTVVAGQTTYLSDIRMQTIRMPLTYSGGPFPLFVYQGYSNNFTVSGTGFRSGGVTGLSFSAGTDVTITLDMVLSDNAAQLTVAALPTATAGARDLTVTRDDGQIVDCAGCLIVTAPDPGSVSGIVSSSDTAGFLPATVTATPVGQSIPAASGSFSGWYSLQGLAAGDYDVLYESPGYISTTQRVTILPGQDTVAYAYLDLPRQPLTITSVSPGTFDTGSLYEMLQVNGSGFRAGGVTGFAATVGSAILVQGVYVNSDSLAYVYIAVPQDAALGTYDVVVSRDPGETATCGGCVTVRKPPGYVYGTVSAACCGALTATVTVTKVGDTVPAVSTTAYGYFGVQLPEGDYIIKVEAPGYVTQWWNNASSEAAATVVSVASGAYVTGIDVALTEIRNPLTIDQLNYFEVFQGQTQYAYVTGAGFLRGGVTGLTFSIGTGVSASVVAVFDDFDALVLMSTAADAALGLRDIVGARDDGETATCLGCVSVLRAQPSVTAVSPSTVREGRRTITVSGDNLQRVVKVVSSSRRVAVQSFTNNADGSISVRIKINGGARRTYTLTFTRDDGSIFSADFSVIK